MSNLLSDLTFFRTYSRIKSNGTREVWDETSDRLMDMHFTKFGPEVADAIIKTGLVEGLKKHEFSPSLRSAQFGGKAIELNNERMYNCSFLHLDSYHAFVEVLFLLACGCGVGWSAQKRHINKMDPISKGDDSQEFMVLDNKESWAKSFATLLRNPQVKFDYSLVRPKGAPLSTGGTASGPEPLMNAHEKSRLIIKNRTWSKLRPIDCHDIACLIADAIICGASRRSACISLFDADDNDLLESKFEGFFNTHPWRVRANNSAIIHRDEPDIKERIAHVVRKCYASNAGEPGILLTNDYDAGTQPCVELYLKPNQFCNLTSVNGAICKTPEDFYRAVRFATIMGTLQSCYDDFSPLLSPKWKKNAEEERLLGVSITGIADNWALFSDANVLRDGAAIARVTNLEWAKKLGINPAARIGCVKPEGTNSALLQTSSGIHAAHSEFYLRRIRVGKETPLGQYLGANLPEEIVPQCVYNPSDYAVTIPMKSQEGSIVRDDETPIELLERAKHVNTNWIRPSHRTGANYHNVSLTCSYKPEHENEVLRWMIDNREFYNGISLLPHNDSAYKQTPFEAVDEQTYSKYQDLIGSFTIDFSKIVEVEPDSPLMTLSCAGGACEIK